MKKQESILDGLNLNLEESEKSVLTTKEAAKYLNTSEKCLGVLRATKRGPEYTKFESNGAIFYFRYELDKYKKARKFTRFQKMHNRPKKAKKNSGQKSLK